MCSIQQINSGFIQKNNLIQDRRRKVNFGQTPVQETPKEENKNVFAFKTATNILGVAAWLFVVGYSLKNLKLLQRKSPEIIAGKAKTLKKRTLNYIEKAADSDTVKNIDNALENTSQKGLRKAIYKMGEAFQGFKMRMGDELFNNMTYAFGTLVVLPTVVLFSPIGKKESSKEDKFFTVLRQPISVAATLGMQFTFDKLISKHVPEVLRKNSLEDKSILDKDGKIKIVDEKGQVLSENLAKIKYNSDSAKEGFKKSVKGLLADNEIDELFNLRSFEDDAPGTYENKFKDILNDKYNPFGLHLKDLRDTDSLNKFKAVQKEKVIAVEKTLDAFKQYIKVLDNNIRAVTKTKIMVNVLFASVIGCTFLNVVYGKVMILAKKHFSKYFGSGKPQKEAKDKEVK